MPLLNGTSPYIFWLKKGSEKKANDLSEDIHF